MQKPNSSSYTLITGASSGIGHELAKIFASKGHNLVLVARNGEKLKEIKKQLIDTYGVKIEIIIKDLSLQNSCQEIFDETTKLGLTIDILVNNAGSGVCGLFHSIEHEKDENMIQLNITSLTSLTKLYAREMIKNGGGRILNVASSGSYQPGPYIAVYYASKSYVLSFSEAIANELKDYGIQVSVLCPGATKTEFSKSAGKAEVKGAMTAEAVAIAAYKGVMNGSKVIRPGMKNKFAIFITRVIPRSLSASMVRNIQENLFNKFGNSK